MAKARVAVLISGTGTNMAALLYASRLVDAAYEVVLVASNDPDAPGLKLAEAEGIPTFALSHNGVARAEHDAAMDRAIRAAGAEYVALAGYMRVIGEEMTARWQGRMLNIHPALLPKYKGLDTHARAIAAGDSHAGASVHLVTGELDGGEVLVLNIIVGELVYLDADDKVIAIENWKTAMQRYLDHCKAHGIEAQDITSFNA